MTARQPDRERSPPLEFRSNNLHVSFGLVAARERLVRSGIGLYVEMAVKAIEHGADVVYLCSFGGNCRVAQKVADKLRQRQDVERIVSCPPRRVVHPSSGDPVVSSLIAVYTANRNRLSVDALGSTAKAE
jgi:hypothetical protein